MTKLTPFRPASLRLPSPAGALLATALLALAACIPTVAPLAPVTTSSPAPQSSGQEPVVILNNRGGNVLQAVQRRNQLARWGGPVEVRGYCGSACTLFITLPNACLDPLGSVGFHAPRIPGTTIIPQGVDQIMGSFYRNGIRQRWDAEWKHSLDIKKISAAEYVRLDPQTRLCR